MFRIFVILFALTSICFSQETAILKQGSLTDGESIVRKARDAAGLSLPINSLRIKLHEFSQEKHQSRGKEVETTSDFQDEIAALSFDKIRIVSMAKLGISNSKFGDFTTTKTSIWNEKRFKQTTETELNGIRKISDTTNSISMDSANKTLGRTKLNMIGIKPPDPKIVFINKLWDVVFPLILMDPIERQTKFEYIGRAQAGEQIASVVETKSASGRVFQLLFDEKTSNLLMTIEKSKTSKGDSEVRYYYSDREKKDNVLIPTKIKIEYKFTPNAGEPPKIFYVYIDIVSFELNPEVKPELFKVD